MSTIETLVNREIVRAAPEDSVQSAVQLMSDGNVGAVLVMAEGRLESIFTERDVVRRVLTAGLDPQSTRLQDVATANPETITETASVRECAHLIREKKCRHLPVLGGTGEVIGMISSRDFLGELASGFERAMEKAYAATEAAEPEDYYDYVVGTFVD